MSTSTKNTNKTNLRIAQETNQANRDIAQETNQANIDIAQMSNEFNAAQLDKQIEQQWKMWEAENEYNSPSAQVERYREAGLNPFLQDVGAGTASSMTSPSPQGAVVPTMQMGAPMEAAVMQSSDPLVKFGQFMNGLGELVNAGREAYGIVGDVQTTMYNKQAYKEQLELLRNNAKISKITAGNEETRQNLEIAGKQLSNDVLYEQKYNHALANIRASVELSALPQQLQLGLAHLAADLGLKYDKHLINDKTLKSIEADILNKNIDYAFKRDTFDDRVRQAGAEADYAENNKGAKDWYQIVQSFLDHVVKGDSDFNWMLETPTGAQNPPVAGYDPNRFRSQR